MVLEALVLGDHVSAALSEMRRPSVSCVAYIKRGVVGVRTLGKSKCPSDTREPKPQNRTSITIYFCIRRTEKSSSLPLTPTAQF